MRLSDSLTAVQSHLARGPRPAARVPRPGNSLARIRVTYQRTEAHNLCPCVRDQGPKGSRLIHQAQGALTGGLVPVNRPPVSVTKI